MGIIKMSTKERKIKGGNVVDYMKKGKGANNYLSSSGDAEDDSNSTNINHSNSSNGSILTGYTGDLEVVESSRYIAFKRRNKDNFYFLLDLGDGEWLSPPQESEVGGLSIEQAKERTKALMMGFIHPSNV